MEGALEVVMLSVDDVDRSKRFYEETLGFVADLDMGEGEGRVVQLTPRGSGCSVQLRPVRPDEEIRWRPGLLLVVADVDAARAELQGRGLGPSPVQHFDESGARVDGRGGRWNSFVMLDDPDGYPWVLQERPTD